MTQTVSIPAAPDFSPYWRPFRERTTVLADVLPFHAEYPALLRNCETLAYLIRSYTTHSMTCAALGHPGGSFSEAEFLAVLYNYVLRFDAANPKWPMRDVFYLSKCHACPGLYTTLALFGYFPLRDLGGYGCWDSHLESHPDWLRTPGIEISGGSLGQIPGVATGRALALRRNGPDHGDRMVYVLLGDGECEAGQVWEAAMAAAHFKADTLTAILDYNKYQETGPISREMALEPLADKWRGFGWRVMEIDGHDMSDIIKALKIAQSITGRPTIIIAHTVKGKGVSFVEADFTWHGRALPPELAEKARKEILTA